MTSWFSRPPLFTIPFLQIQLLSDLLLHFSLSLIPILLYFFRIFLGFFNFFSLWGFFSLPAMTEVLHLPSSPRSSALSNDGFFQAQTAGSGGLGVEGDSRVTGAEGQRVKDREQLSLLALLVTLFRKSLVVCKTDREELCAMEIGWPTNVRHVAHVTFDRFNGFLGLPVEFEPEVPRRAPSARWVFFPSFWKLGYGFCVFCCCGFEFVELDWWVLLDCWYFEVLGFLLYVGLLFTFTQSWIVDCRLWIVDCELFLFSYGNWSS